MNGHATATGPLTRPETRSAWDAPAAPAGLGFDMPVQAAVVPWGAG